MAGLPPFTTWLFLESVFPQPVFAEGRACIITDTDKGTPSAGLMAEDRGRAPSEAGE